VSAIVKPTESKLLGEQFELRSIIGQQCFDDWDSSLLLVKSDGAGFGKMCALADA
jgi:hypothetical protein